MLPAVSAAIHYPESDGQPLANNTEQLHWIVLLFDNLAARFALDPRVFVAADLLWYPVEGHPEVRVAPDVLIAFGRPPGPRGSYRQWDEDNVPVTVAIEVLSPGNSAAEMMDKLAFYDEHGVEEYYVYDPDTNRLLVYLRQGEVLRRVRPLDRFVSPRLGVRFDPSATPMAVYHPDGQPFISFEEQRQLAEEQRRIAEEQRQLAEEQRRIAEEQRQLAEEQRRIAEEREGRAAAEEARAEKAEAALAELRKRLKEAGLATDETE